MPQAATLRITGELALFDRKPRAASVVCEEECFLLLLEEQNFASFMACLPDFRRRVEALRDFTQHRARSSSIFAMPAAVAVAGVAAVTQRRLPSLSPPPPLDAWVSSLYGPPPPVVHTTRGKLQIAAPPPGGLEPGGGTAALAPVAPTSLREAGVLEQGADGRAGKAAAGGVLVQSSVGFVGIAGFANTSNMPAR